MIGSTRARLRLKHKKHLCFSRRFRRASGEVNVPKRVRDALLGRGLAILLAALLAGCATVPTTPTPERAEGREDPLQPVAGESIGTVILVDPEEEIALIRMRSAGTRSAPSMVARNEALVETARLEPTRFQRGRTLGARIVSGLPNVGDEVVVAR